MQYKERERDRGKELETNKVMFGMYYIDRVRRNARFLETAGYENKLVGTMGGGMKREITRAIVVTM